MKLCHFPPILKLRVPDFLAPDIPVAFFEVLRELLDRAPSCFSISKMSPLLSLTTLFIKSIRLHSW